MRAMPRASLAALLVVPLALACDRKREEPAPPPVVSASAPASVAPPPGPPVGPASDMPLPIARAEARLLSALPVASRAKLQGAGATMLMRASMTASAPKVDAGAPEAVAWTREIAAQIASGVGSERGNVLLVLVAGARAAAKAADGGQDVDDKRVAAADQRIRAAIDAELAALGPPP